MGHLVGRYQIQARIGQGAMANVYRAYDPSINRVLAIKLLKAEYRLNRQYAARFLREAKAAGALSHPNIVTIYDVGEVGGHAYIAMELLEGAPLDSVIRPGAPLSVPRVVDIGLQLAGALRYAHDLGVIHRDIKPSNIMLAPDGRSVKILDFGIARMGEADNPEDDADGLRTQIGQVIGTPRYMSPEQAFGQRIDGRSDLFSVGVVLYELIAGRSAFTGASPASLALQITQKDPQSLGELAPDCPRGLQFIIEKLLAKDPDRRFASGAHLMDALRREERFFNTHLGEAREGRRRLPLQFRQTLLMALMTALVLAMSTGAVVTEEISAMRRMAITSGVAMASFVASNAALQAAENAGLPADQRDWMPVQAFIGNASRDADVRGMAVVDTDGVIRASSDPKTIGRRHAVAAVGPVVERDANLTVSALPSVGGATGFRFSGPLVYAGRSFGTVVVDLGEAPLWAAARQARELLAALALLTLAVVVASSYLASRLLALPIRRLKAALGDAAGGNLDFRISHRRRDEFGELFDAFNRFTGVMQQRLEAAGAARPGPGHAARSDRPPAPMAVARPVPGDVATLIIDEAAGPAIPGKVIVPTTSTPAGGNTIWRDRWARAVQHPPIRAGNR